MTGNPSMTSDLGTARAIDARSQGEPGRRTFHVRVLGSRAETALLWVEKQHIMAMAMAFSQLLAQLGHDQKSGTEIAEFPSDPDYQFRVGRMSIGYDPNDKAVVLHVFAEGRDDDDDEPDILVRISRDDCAALNATLEEIISTGRPLCPLCATPMDDNGHTCIRSNGHSMQPIPKDRIEDAEDEG
jgi:uncharacterized repeat protein (TIGR03847 family)